MFEPRQARIAYFSMEIAVDPALPTYAGGLGILSGDVLRSAADRELPIVGVTLAHRKGYFRQSLDAQGRQTESPDEWHPEALAEPTEPRITVALDSHRFVVRAWRYLIRGITGFAVPVYFLDADIPENPEQERKLTDHLYGGDEYYRLCQEALLGIGGVQFMRASGHQSIERFHMNEGHSALLALALLEERMGRKSLASVSEAEVEAVRQQCVFTTHTPVPAAHDQFSSDLVGKILGPDRAALLEASHCCVSGKLNMTYLALRFSRYINGVAMRHGEIEKGLFPNYPIHAITNGVHALTWTVPSMRELYDRYIPGWRQDNLYLRYAIGIATRNIQQAHAEAKREMIQRIAEATGARLQESVATIGFARRAAAYKRADLLFADLQRLRAIRAHAGPLQVVYAGKAHPRDEEGKALIGRVFQAAESLRDVIPVVYLQNYDMTWARVLTGGVDLWLNTPHRPYEASGTSGMKAALNGVPSLSIRDGWWVEGHCEGVTGWSIGFDEDPEKYEIEVASLYGKLEHVILPMFYARPEAYAEVMRWAIALNGSFFNTQRMISQYLQNAYFPRSKDPENKEPPSA